MYVYSAEGRVPECWSPHKNRDILSRVPFSDPFSRFSILGVLIQVGGRCGQCSVFLTMRCFNDAVFSNS